MLLYIYSGNSLRAVEKSMEVFNFVFPFLGLKVPSYVTVRDWVLKAGLDTYSHRCKHLPVDEAYAIVMDESITIAEHNTSRTQDIRSASGQTIGALRCGGCRHPRSLVP